MEGNRTLFIIGIVILVTLIIITAIILFVLLGGGGGGSTDPDNPYPDDYPIEDYNNYVEDGELDLDTPLVANDFFRKIGIVERYKLGSDKYLNLDVKTELKQEGTYVGSKLTSKNGNNVYLFFDDFIFDRKGLTFDMETIVTDTGRFSILKQLDTTYSSLDLGGLDEFTNLFIYARGLSVGLGILAYFKTNPPNKEALMEGYPSITSDPLDIVYQTISSDERTTFVNNLSDPLLELVSTQEYDSNNEIVYFDYIHSTTVIANKGLKDYEYHSIINYLDN